MDRKRSWPTYALLGGAASLLVFAAVASPRHGATPTAPLVETPRPMAHLATAPRGRNVTSSNTRLFSRSVRSASAPPSM